MFLRSLLILFLVSFSLSLFAQSYARPDLRMYDVERLIIKSVSKKIKKIENYKCSPKKKDCDPIVKIYEYSYKNKRLVRDCWRYKYTDYKYNLERKGKEFSHYTQCNDYSYKDNVIHVKCNIINMVDIGESWSDKLINLFLNQDGRIIKRIQFHPKYCEFGPYCEVRSSYNYKEDGLITEVNGLIISKEKNSVSEIIAGKIKDSYFYNNQKNLVKVIKKSDFNQKPKTYYYSYDSKNRLKNMKVYTYYYKAPKGKSYSTLPSAIRETFWKETLVVDLDVKYNLAEKTAIIKCKPLRWGCGGYYSNKAIIYFE